MKTGISVLAAILFLGCAANRAVPTRGDEGLVRGAVAFPDGSRWSCRDLEVTAVRTADGRPVGRFDAHRVGNACVYTLEDAPSLSSLAIVPHAPKAWSCKNGQTPRLRDAVTDVTLAPYEVRTVDMGFTCETLAQSAPPTVVPGAAPAMTPERSSTVSAPADAQKKICTDAC